MCKFLLGVGALLPKELFRIREYIYYKNRKHHKIRIFPRIVDKNLVGISVGFHAQSDCRGDDELAEKICKVIRDLSHGRLIPKGSEKLWEGKLDLDYVGMHIDMKSVSKALTFIYEDMLEVMYGKKSIH